MNRSELIKEILKVSYKNKSGHIPSALSILDLVYTIYNTFIFDKTKENVFILSKGHGSLALYATFYAHKIITKEIFYSHTQHNSLLGGHPDATKIKEIIASTGSLGHGLPFGLGVALAKKLLNQSGSVIVIIGDGEMNEGTIWESLLVAKTLNLNNLICILDNNLSNSNSVDLGNIRDKILSFDWNYSAIDGHNSNQIINAISNSINQLTFINAKTIKGFGVKSMENNPAWHNLIIQDVDIDDLLNEVYI